MRLFSIVLLSASFVASFPARADEAVELNVGDPAPSFVVMDDQGKPWKSSDHFGDKVVVIYFYPADMTGGCTAQACGYRDNLAKLADQNVEIVGVSGDSVQNHQWFKQAHDLNFTLLADTEGEVAAKFGVPTSKGDKTVKATIAGIERLLKRSVTTKRWTFVVDREGNIAYKDDKVKAKADPEKIAAAIASMR